MFCTESKFTPYNKSNWRTKSGESLALPNKSLLFPNFIAPFRIRLFEAHMEAISLRVSPEKDFVSIRIGSYRVNRVEQHRGASYQVFHAINMIGKKLRPGRHFVVTLHKMFDD